MSSANSAAVLYPPARKPSAPAPAPPTTSSTVEGPPAMGATTRGQRESSRTASAEEHRVGGGRWSPPTLTHLPLRWAIVDLDLVDTLRSTGAVRQFHPGPVADDVLARLLDTARFAPSGGNRQGWRRHRGQGPGTRTALRDLYLSGWYEYLAMVSAGLVPWAPVTDREAEAAAVANAAQFAEARRRPHRASPRRSRRRPPSCWSWPT